MTSVYAGEAPGQVARSARGASIWAEWGGVAAVIAASRSEAEPDPAAALVVTADDLDQALADLLDTRNAMTRAVVGFRDGGEDGAESG